MKNAAIIDWIESTAGKTLCVIELGVDQYLPASYAVLLNNWPIPMRMPICSASIKGIQEWPGHGGYSMVPKELKGRRLPMRMTRKKS